MYALVQYTTDNVYFVCKTSCIKRWKGKTIVKWLDNYFYEAKVISMSTDLHLLNNICKNVTEGYPVINLERCNDNQVKLPPVSVPVHNLHNLEELRTVCFDKNTDESDLLPLESSSTSSIVCHGKETDKSCLLSSLSTSTLPLVSQPVHNLHNIQESAVVCHDKNIEKFNLIPSEWLPAHNFHGVEKSTIVNNKNSDEFDLLSLECPSVLPLPLISGPVHNLNTVEESTTVYNKNTDDSNLLSSECSTTLPSVSAVLQNLHNVKESTACHDKNTDIFDLLSSECPSTLPSTPVHNFQSVEESAIVCRDKNTDKYNFSSESQSINPIAKHLMTFSEDKLLNYILCQFCSNLILEEDAGQHSIMCEKHTFTNNTNNYYSGSELDVDSNEESNEDKKLCMYCGYLCTDLLTHLSVEHNKDGSDIEEKDNNSSKNSKIYLSKQHFCCYCKTLQYKLARHLERKHPHEVDVKEAITFPKGTKSRRLLFAEIQKKGDFLYATQNDIDSTILTRRSYCGLPPFSTVVCPYCKGFYSKKNLRNHVKKKCLAKAGEVEHYKQLGMGNIMINGRSVFPKMHKIACDALKHRIFPVMRDDEITNAIAYDELAMQYGNFLVNKYASSKHHDNMIRSKLRLLSRTFLQMKKADAKITNVKSIFDSTNFSNFVSSVYKVAGLEEGKFKNPSLGPSIVTLILQVGSVLETNAIEMKNCNLEKEVRRFCKLVTTRANSLINKIAMENRTQVQRSKVVLLPKTDDIFKLQQILDAEIKHCIEALKHTFQLKTWITLNKAVLVKIMVFNRKRPGDIERSQIVEYQNIQVVTEEQMKLLDNSQKNIAATYGRYIARGKLDRPAAILVSKEEMEAIQILLKFRSNAGVDQSNPFLFATVANSTEQFCKAGRILNEFCTEYNLENKNLSATKLRKHFATITCTLEKEKQMQISDFMGHAFDIHQNIYRQRPAAKDILEMTDVLKIANGVQISLNETEDISSTLNMSSLESPIHRQSALIPSNSLLPITDALNETTINRGKSPQYFTPTESSSDELDDERSVYSPDLSRISEESDDTSDYNTNKKKTNRTRKHKTYRINKKSTWTTPERSTVKTIFKNYFVEGNDAVPGLDTCQQFIHENNELRHRTASQVRSWIIQEKKRKERSIFLLSATKIFKYRILRS